MTSKAVYEKSTCCVIGCESWSRRYPGQWICGRHWKLVRKSRRRALRRLWREIDALWTGEAPVTGSPLAKLCKRERRMWSAARREATLSAAGL